MGSCDRTAVLSRHTYRRVYMVYNIYGIYRIYSGVLSGIVAANEKRLPWVRLSLCHRIIISDYLVVNVCHFTYGPKPTLSLPADNYGVARLGRNRTGKNRKFNYLFMALVIILPIFHWLTRQVLLVYRTVTGTSRESLD